MTKRDINILLSSAFEISQVSENEFDIITSATYHNGEKIVINLSYDNESYILSDNKATLKYMNSIYELKSEDVKSCISSVIKIYEFKIIAGALTGIVKDETILINKIFDFINCIAQLSNMFAFFDNP